MTLGEPQHRFYRVDSGADRPLPLGAWTFPQCRWSLTTIPLGSPRSTSTELAGQPVQVSRQGGMAGLWGAIPPACPHHEEQSHELVGHVGGYSPRRKLLGHCPFKSKGRVLWLFHGTYTCLWGHSIYGPNPRQSLLPHFSPLNLSGCQLAPCSEWVHEPWWGCCCPRDLVSKFKPSL